MANYPCRARFTKLGTCWLLLSYDWWNCSFHATSSACVTRLSAETGFIALDLTNTHVYPPAAEQKALLGPPPPLNCLIDCPNLRYEGTSAGGKQKDSSFVGRQKTCLAVTPSLVWLGWWRWWRQRLCTLSASSFQLQRKLPHYTSSLSPNLSC